MYQILEGESIEELNQNLSEFDNIEWVGNITSNPFTNYYEDGRVCSQWVEYYLPIKLKYEE